jgi:threonine aldolase
LTVAYTQAVGELAHSQNLQLHVDGARIFNAAVALGVPAHALAAPADSLTFCLSKALSAPVGSVIVGERNFITKAHRIRKILGGGMRQAGVLAAAGIVALETMIDRLAEDHQRARKLAAGLSQIPGLALEPGSPYTNMVFVNLTPETGLSAGEVAKRLKPHGVLAGTASARQFRLVTHCWVDDQAIDQAVTAFGKVL